MRQGTVFRVPGFVFGPFGVRLGLLYVVWEFGLRDFSAVEFACLRVFEKSFLVHTKFKCRRDYVECLNGPPKTDL